MRPFLIAALTMALICGGARAHDVDHGTVTTSPAHRGALDAARARVEQQLGKPVVFQIKQFQVSGDWAFLHAGMIDPKGQPISYAGTRFAEADSHGQKSSNYDALLHQSGGHWTIRVDSIGATDVPWTNWSHDYGAPAKLFDGSAH